MKTVGRNCCQLSVTGNYQPSTDNRHLSTKQEPFSPALLPSRFPLSL